MFKHKDNKLEVQHCGGIAKALQLLKETDSTETQKQITGRTFYLDRTKYLVEGEPSGPFVFLRTYTTG